MVDYLIFGVDSGGSRTQIASTPSAWAAKACRDAGRRPWEKIVVVGTDGEISATELDQRAALENRLVKRS